MQRWLGLATNLTLKIAACVTVISIAGGGAQATDGYFQYGYGARQGGLGGAGVADSRDAMSLSLNPAGLVDVDHQLQAGAALFAPFRGYTGTGTGFVAPGTIDSSSNYFVVPNIAYSKPIDLDSAWGVAMFGNGGMNTTYKNVTNTTGCPGGGVFCAGDAGVDLIQAFISAGYARRFGAFSVGVAPVAAIQRIKVDGLGAFAASSSDAANLTDRGYDWSYGGGVRGGLQWNVTNNVRLGFSAQSKMWMTKFSKYSGLFAEQGSFDIPANLTAGIAIDVMPNFTWMVDYKRIFYSQIASIGDSSAITGAGVLGTSNGPGFGWSDVSVIKIGAEWRYSPTWTFRTGYSHNTNPISSSDVTLNIIAPGVVTDHITAGFSYKMTKNTTFDFAAAYVPRSSVSGSVPATSGGGTVELEMNQYQFTAGLTYQFDTAPAPTHLIYK
jgi:long-chain fatty acid transport protein